jgi:hypothetical protein
MLRSIGVLAAVVVSANFARAEPASRNYVNENLGVRLKAPFGWTVQRESSYARILVSLLHQSGARMTLAVQPLGPSTSPGAFVAGNREAMKKIGFQLEEAKPRLGGFMLEAKARKGPLRIRQWYTASGGIGYVLTMSADAEHVPRFSTAFDYAISHLEIEPPEPAEPEASPTGDGGAP